MSNPTDRAPLPSGDPTAEDLRVLIGTDDETGFCWVQVGDASRDKAAIRARAASLRASLSSGSPGTPETALGDDVRRDAERWRIFRRNVVVTVRNPTRENPNGVVDAITLHAMSTVIPIGHSMPEQADQYADMLLGSPASPLASSGSRRESSEPDDKQLREAWKVVRYAVRDNADFIATQSAETADYIRDSLTFVATEVERLRASSSRTASPANAKTTNMPEVAEAWRVEIVEKALIAWHGDLMMTTPRGTPLDQEAWQEGARRIVRALAAEPVELVRSITFEEALGSSRTAEATRSPSEQCEWTWDDDGFYKTSCGRSWFFDSGTPAENHAHFCFCCGKPLSVRSASLSGEPR